MAEPHDKTRQAQETFIRTGSGVEFPPGASLGGRYEVISRLGEGGMGVVYRVNQIFLNKQFALKTVDRHAMSDVTIRRFQQEALTSFAVDHPNVVAVHDFGLLDDETPFLVMELINGETLGERIKRAGSLPIDQAIPIFIQICLGLAYAHECGIVHRDIKPSNVMLIKGMPSGVEGSVKILDFGIAKYTAHEGGEIQALTRTGEIFGSPAYMSPEQCSGLKIDHRADIYSLGCLFFETLTGTTPFISDSALSTMLKHQAEVAPTLKEASLGGKFPTELENILAKMLAKSPDQRYQNLGVLAHDLAAVLRGDPLPSKSNKANSVAIKAAKTITISKSRFYQIVLSAAAVTAIISGAIGYFISSNQKDNADEFSKNNQLKSASMEPLSDIRRASIATVIEPLIPKGTTEAIGKRGADILKTDVETFKKIDTIYSKIITVDGAKLRQFNFPDRSLGAVTTIPKYGPKGQVTTPLHFTAQGPVRLPANAPIMLDIGGNASPWIFQYTWVMRKIDINEFDGLKIVNIKNPLAMAISPDVNYESLESDGAMEILKIASKWSKLNTLELDSIPTDKNVAAAISSLPHLDRLILSKIFVTSDEFSKAPFLLHLQDLWLNQVPTDAILQNVAHSSNLKILSVENCKVSLASFVSLKNCTHLEELSLKDASVNDASISAISEIKSLKKLIMDGATLTTKQKDILSAKNIDVKYQSRIWGIH